MAEADPLELIVDVWKIPLLQPESLVEDLSELLSPEETVRAKRFHRERDGRRFTVAHAAVRQILSYRLAVKARSLQFQSEDHGKPFLPELPVQFNLSHSGELALLAITPERRLGVDVEEHRSIPDAIRIAERFFSTREREQLQRLAADPPAMDKAFLECWTRKEAFIKAVGFGLSYPLDSFEVTFFPDQAQEIKIPSKPSELWRLRAINPGSGYHAALVVQGIHPAEVIHIRTHNWQPVI